MADPGFVDRGGGSLDRGRQFGCGAPGQMAHQYVDGNLKNRFSLSKIGDARLLSPPPGSATDV